jgi:molybdopterin converting factor small subunit
MTHIHFYGRISDEMGSMREIDIPEQGLTVGALREILNAQSDTMDIQSATIRVSINDEIVPDTAQIQPHDDVSIMSPFSGG